MSQPPAKGTSAALLGNGGTNEDQRNRYYVAKKMPGSGLKDHEEQIDMKKLRGYRLTRVRQELKKRDLGGCMLFDPINIRYSTGTRNMMVWTQHSPDRFVFIATEGPVILFEREWFTEGTGRLETVDEYRSNIPWYYESAGSRMHEFVGKWADEVDDLINSYGGGNHRLALDRIAPAGIKPLLDRNIELFDAQEPLEQARLIKCSEEIACMLISIASVEAGIANMREALRPGMTENDLWSILHQTAIALGGELAETRLLSSGGRTNPWFQECSDKWIRTGELVALDTDYVGPYGYCADISRTLFCGPGKPSNTQKNLYKKAHEQVFYNIDLLQPGRSFREVAEKAWVVPNGYYRDRFGPVHGIGMCDEYPDIPEAADWEESGYDGVIEENMTLCVESYMGAPGSAEGVKLEEQVLVTKNGPQILSTFPFEDILLE